MVPEKPLEISPLARHSDSLFRDFEKSFDLVEGPKECVSRLYTICRRTQSPVVLQCICEGWGAHLEDLTVSGK